MFACKSSHAGLLFLLFSFSSEPELAGLDKDMQLPQSTSKTDFQDTIKLVLSQSTLKMGDEIVAQIENDVIIGLDPKNLKSSGLYIRLAHQSESLNASVTDPEGPRPIRGRPPRTGASCRLGT